MKKIYKNPVENPDGSIDCIEIHPVYGEIDHTQDPAFEYELSEELGPEDWADVKPCPQSEKDAHNQSVTNTESLAYLTSTDWYVTRKIETGKDIPDDVIAKRKEARELIK
jgi:hypothetical protein